MSNCEGCNTREGPGDYFDCSYIANNKDGSCPCTECIVKAMCDIPCDDYEKWNYNMEI